jgi:hypothetical protein
VILVLKMLAAGSVLAALACWAGAIYCWVHAVRNAKPGAGDRFMRVGLWTNLTPTGNRYYRNGALCMLGFLVLIGVCIGLVQLQTIF